MTRRRWIADEVSGNQAVLIGPHAEHLARVLRARVGQQFDIAIGSAVRRGLITSIEDHRVEFELGDEVPSVQAEPITLALSIFKFDRMEWAIEKCTELGVAQIMPVIAQRTEPHLAAASVKRVERWQRLVNQASEQSRRTSPPQILAALKSHDLAKIPGNQRILLSELENELMLKDAVQDGVETEQIVIAVGPEGGWTENELEIFRTCGWTSASLGGTILRTETAAIAALAILISELT